MVLCDGSGIGFIFVLYEFREWKNLVWVVVLGVYICGLISGFYIILWFFQMLVWNIVYI